MSIENLAIQIFNQPPQSPKSQQIIIHQVIEDTNTSMIDIFEVFITILMEGMMIVYLHPTWEQVKLLQIEHLLNLQPWLRSLGFKLIATQHDNISDVSNYYCKVILQCDPDWNTYFKIKNINKEYYFMLGNRSPYIKQTSINLKTLYGIFICDGKIYKISFDLD